jgi:hypothetical protein
VDAIASGKPLRDAGGRRHPSQAVLHAMRSDYQQISAHASERNTSWMSARLS